MKRVGFLLKVKPDMIEEYKKHHTAVWPEMLEALSPHRLAQLLPLHARRWHPFWLL
jgi:L-rhamnose mutarotase